MTAAAAGAAAPLLVATHPRAALLRALTALAAANPWYDTIVEFRPIVDVGRAPLGRDLVSFVVGYGLLHAAALWGLRPLLREWRAEPERRPALVALFVALAVVVPLALVRRRFGMYAAIPLAIAAEAGVRDAAAALTSRLRARWAPPGAVLALCLAVVAPGWREHLAFDPAIGAEEEQALRWIAATEVEDGREAVLAPWTLGHLVQYFADRPVVASPFGTEGGDGAMEDAAAFWFATDGEAAEAVLARRRCGWVVLESMIPHTVNAFGFAPPGTPLPARFATDLWRGRGTDVTDAFWSLVPNRLYYSDGGASAGGPPLDGFRLVFETPSTSPRDASRERQWMVFQPIRGARLVVASSPGATIRASIALKANTDRTFDWATQAAAGEDGGATLRLPYASGFNGEVRGSAWTVTDGVRALRLVLHEEDVRSGATFDVDLRAGAVRRRDQAAPSRAVSGASSASSSAATRPNSSANSAR